MPTATQSQRKRRNGDRPSEKKVELVQITSLCPYRNNARTHSARQLKQIARSIERFGFNNPVLVDQGNQIIAGHGRVAAAKMLGYEAVPALRIEHLSDAEKRAFIIADNRLAGKAGWDNATLAIEFQGLADLGFDIELTGFEIPEIELILDAADATADRFDDDTIPDLTPGHVICTPGDLWSLGGHRLFCGDARDRRSFSTLLEKECAQLVFVDPPYNVKIHGHASGKGRITHREFVQASGEKTSPQFTKFLEDCLSLLAEHSVDGAIHFAAPTGDT